MYIFHRASRYDGTVYVRLLAIEFSDQDNVGENNHKLQLGNFATVQGKMARTIRDFS